MSDWSVAEFDPLLYCTPSSYTRCSMFWMLFSELEAVCTIEMASLALLLAWSRPLTWEVRPSEIAYPAASSAALLMRRPEDRRSIDVETAFEEFSRFC